MTAKILIVDDEDAIRELLMLGLEAAGFEVREAADARAALTQLADQRPDLMLLDWMLPSISGIELARRLKRDPDFADLPIIMLTARGEEDSKVLGLESGADDYVTKPFSSRELVSRIKAVLRRQKPHLFEEPLVCGALRLNPAAKRVTAAGEPLTLGPTEYRLLEFFMSHTDKVYSREQLLDRVWGGNVYIEDRTVDVHVLRLRRALKPSACDTLLETVRGAGYRFVASAAPRQAAVPAQEAAPVTKASSPKASQ